MRQALTIAALAALLTAAACERGPEQKRYTVMGSPPETCIECHERINPGLLKDHRASPHERIPLLCEECHGEDHDEMFRVKGAVAPTVCARCHEKEYVETRRSRHGMPLKGGKLEPLLSATLQPTGGCTATGGCHNIQRVYPDGSVGRCSACHITHAFRNAEARDPRLCYQCHSGRDNPEYEMWLRSAHSLPSPSGEGYVADCVDCHDTHDVSGGIIHGVPPLQNSGPIKQIPTASKEDFEKQRGIMLDRCVKCHVRRFAKNALDQADLWRYRGAQMLDEAAEIVERLDRDGLLHPSPGKRERNPVAGHALKLGGAQIFDRIASLPERLYYEMHLHHYPRLYRASYHTDPERVTWYLNDDLKSALDRLREVDRAIRAEARGED